MRTVKELFKLMLVHQDLFSSGICYWLEGLRYSGLINKSEILMMLAYMRDNKPENARRFYWWDEGEIQPRLDWINQQIELQP